MAYFFKKRLGLAEPMPNPTAPRTAAGGSSVASSSPATPAAPGSSATSGSGWVNLQDYLAVNGAQGKAMAEGLVGNVAGQGAAAKQAVDNLSQQHAGGVQGDEAAGRDIQQTSLGSVAGYGDVANQAAKAEQQTKGLVDFGQRGTQLADMYGAAGGYSPGMKRWDSFGSGAGGGDVLKQAADQYGGLSDYLNQATAKSAETATAAQGRVGENRVEQERIKAEKQAAEAEASRLRDIAEDESRSEAERKKAQDDYNLVVQGIGTAFMPLAIFPGAVGALAAQFNQWFGKK